ncbi:MAG: alpha-mannosidase [Candidatus Methylacidiphilales bacterium]
MLPTHNLLTLVHNRAQKALRRVEQAIWEPVCELDAYASPALPLQRSWHQALEEPLTPVGCGTFWGKLFDQRWLKVELPPVEGQVWLHFDEQSESTLYINGQPYFGLDLAHRYCRLPENVQTLWIECNCLQSAIWHRSQRPMQRHGAYFESASLVRRNELAWQAFYDLQCLVELMLDLRRREDPKMELTPSMCGTQDRLESYPPAYRRLLRLLSNAVDALDQKGLGTMCEELSKAYHELKGCKSFSRCIATGHAHIDLVWLWPERIGELKAVHTFATANRLMDEYPEYRFAYSQPASYEAVSRREPGLFRAVQQRIASGQWQATGAMYVESDTMLACGEALARSFEIGQEGFIALRGSASPLCWLPDVFGYSACLPQIMKLTGVDFFFTTKLTWNAVNRFPYSSFVWRGHDGSEVLAHVSQDIGYVTSMRVVEVKKAMYGNQQADLHDEFLLATGYGDGGGGPTAGMCERARRLSSLPGMPEIAWDHPEAFFQRLQSKRSQLPVHQGECYIEAHRGTFTTHQEVKATFRALERALQCAEAVAARTGCHLELEPIWKRVIFFQFHDYIPGSSVWDVYEEGISEARRLAMEADAMAAKALNDAANGTAPCLFNPHARTVRTLLSDGSGLVDLPPLSGVELASSPRIAAPAVEVQPRRISNGLVDLSLDEKGCVESLHWPEGAARIHSPFGALEIYPDQAAEFDAWEIDRHVLSLGTLCLDTPEIKEYREPSGRAGLSVSRRIGRESHAEIRFLLQPGSAECIVDVTIDWRETEHLAKLIFPTAYRARHARFGAPFGSVLRAQTPEGLSSEMVWEVPYSRYLAVFEEGESEGLCVVSESNYGATVRDGVIGLSLVRSPKVTGQEHHAAGWPGHLSRLDNPPVFSDLGKQTMRFVLGHYRAQHPTERQPASMADVWFTPALPYEGSTLSAPFLRIDGLESIVPAWVKPLREGGWLVRWHEVAGKSGSLRLAISDGWQAGTASFAGQWEAAPASEVLEVPFDPYQIQTLAFSAS